MINHYSKEKVDSLVKMCLSEESLLEMLVDQWIAQLQ